LPPPLLIGAYILVGPHATLGSGLLRPHPTSGRRDPASIAGVWPSSPASGRRQIGPPTTARRHIRVDPPLEHVAPAAGARDSRHWISEGEGEGGGAS